MATVTQTGRVQSGFGGSPRTITIPFTPVAGRVLVVQVGFENDVTAVGDVTDNQSTVYTNDGGLGAIQAGGYRYREVFRSAPLGATVPTTLTVAWTGGNSTLANFEIVEVSGEIEVEAAPTNDTSFFARTHTISVTTGAASDVVVGTLPLGGGGPPDPANVTTSPVGVGLVNNAVAQALAFYGDDLGAAGAKDLTFSWLEADGSGQTVNYGVIVYREPAAAAIPTISGITPATATPSSNLTITGTNFEAAQGTGVVTVSPTDNVADAAAVTATINTWADTSIATTGTPFPTGTAHDATLYVFVTNDSGETNAAGFQITASYAPTASEPEIFDETIDGFSFRFNLDVDNGLYIWAAYATEVARNAATVEAIQIEVGALNTALAAGQVNVTAVGLQTVAGITGLGENQTRYVRVFPFGDYSANGV